jgi:hypothetical protein
VTFGYSNGGTMQMRERIGGEFWNQDVRLNVIAAAE